MSHTKNAIISWIRTTDAEVEGTATYLFTYSSAYMIFYQIDMYLYVRIDVWEKMTKKRTEHPPAAGRRREHGLGRYL